MKKRRTARRLLAVLLALSLALSLLPVTAMAEGLEDDESITETEPGEEGSTQIDSEEEEQIDSEEEEQNDSEGTTDPEEDENDPLQEEDEGEEDAPVPSSEVDGAVTYASNGKTYTRVTNTTNLTTGKYIMVDEGGYAPTTVSGSYVLSVQAVADMTTVPDTITNAEDSWVWMVTVKDDGTVALTSSDGNTIGHTGSSNGVSTGADYFWYWTAGKAEGTISFIDAADVDSAGYFFGRNTADTSNRYRGFGKTNYNTFPRSFTLYVDGDYVPPVETKVATPTATPAGGSTVAAGATVTLSCGTSGVTYQASTDNGTNWTPLTGNTFTIPENATGTYAISVKATKANLEDSDVLALTYTILDTSKVSTIADARKGQSSTSSSSPGEVFVVSGVVTYVSGSSFYIQDDTAGIVLFTSGLGFTRGQKVTVSGGLVNYNGLLELCKVETISTEAGTLPAAKEVTIADIAGSSDTYQSQLVKITGAKVTAVDGTTVTLSADGTDTNTINITSCPTVANLTAEDVVTVTAVVSTTKNVNTLLVNAASDVVITEDNTPAQPDLYKPATGDVVVIYGSGYALTGTAAGNQLAGASATKNGEKLKVTGTPAELTVTVSGDNYTFKTSDGKYLAATETSNQLVLTDAPTDGYQLWTLETASGGWYLTNVTAKFSGTPLSIEVFNGNFTSYSTTGTKGAAYLLEFYKAENVEATAGAPAPDPYTGYKPVNGDVVAIYNAGSGKAMNFSMGGTAGSPSGDTLYTDGSQLMLTVSVDSDGYYTFTDKVSGLVLSGEKSGKTISMENPISSDVCTRWELVQGYTGYYMRNVDSTNSNYEYIEYYSNNFTAYFAPKGTDDGIYGMQFFKKVGTAKDVDALVEQTIAQWGGGGPYRDASIRSVNGDLLTVGDMLDSSSTFTAVVDGSPVQPFTEGVTNNVVTAWYMGGSGIGSGSNDYLQFETSTKGWGGMTVSFRMRASNAGAGSWQVQYSTDGTNFVNFTTGTYSYAYTTYTTVGGVSTPNNIVGSGSFTDGVARTSIAPAYNVSFSLNVPAGAEDAEKLYIRLVPGSDKANGADGAIGSTATIRIDTVKLVGSPIVDSGITSYVDINPDNFEEVGAGEIITLSCATPGATIHYGWANSDGSVTYTTGTSATVPATLPATLFAYATAPGKADSVVRIMTYSAATVPSVKMSPNGGGVNTSSGSVEVTLSCALSDVTIYYSMGEYKYDGDTLVKDEDDNPVLDYKVYTPGTTKITLAKGFGEQTIYAYAERSGFTTSSVTARVFTERQTDRYQLFFGQMHSHTNYSDGSGTPQDAFNHVLGLDHSVYNMDFLSITDHSNSLDGAGKNDRTINDPFSDSPEWTNGNALAKSVTTDGKFVGIFGYEMTWSNGLGHINTFNTAGFQDRTQSAYTTYSTALQNYYAMLKTAPASISQFNHPGTTFGDFSDFSYFDEEIDQLITLIEVGNGEGAIGSSGYFPSYEYYTRALDKGWHVAPTNNQDNHKGGWGSANTGRDVVLVDELTEDAIYDAMRNYRVYATEDLNLEIYYQFDGNIMGTILDAGTYQKDETIQITVELNDPNKETATVEVIVNGGKSLAVQKDVSCTNNTVTFNITDPGAYSYYYIKVTQADGDIAVTAPVWVGKVEAVGITSLSADSALTIAGEKQSFTLELYNNENSHLEVSSITFTDKASGTVLATATDVTRVPRVGTASTSFSYTFTKDGTYTIVAEVKGTLNGAQKTYTQELELKVIPVDVVSRIIVDGSHGNDYVTGYYGGNMSNMTSIAANLGVEVIIATQITPDMLTPEYCQMLVISAPAKANGTANAGSYMRSTFSQEFINMVRGYVEAGGMVVVCGIADYQDGSGNYQTSVQQNALLEGIGSTMRINDDEAIDDEKNGGQPFRLYLEEFDMTSPWCSGIVTIHDVTDPETEVYQTYSQYSGCTVNPGAGQPLVFGHSTTWGGDSDKDGRGILEGKSYSYTFNDKNYTLDAVTDMGEAVFLACEDVGANGGIVFAAGGVFLSDFEVKEVDTIYDLPYANVTIFANMLSQVRSGITITPIAETRTAALGQIFVIEGWVTAGTTHPGTTFFDSIYVQDESGGTDVFPYATEGLELGTKVRVLGYTDDYQGDRELQVISLEVLNAPKKLYAPTPLTTKQAADYANYGGLLVSTSGTVSGIVEANGRISQFNLTDSSGVPATVFIDGYITNEDGINNIHTWLKNGQTVSAVGLLYSHPEGESDVSVPVLRVRNCDEIELISDQPAVPDTPEPPAPSIPSIPSTPGGSGSPGGSGASSGNTDTGNDQPAEPSLPVTTGSSADGGAVVTETRAVIESEGDGSSASATVSEEIGKEIVEQTVRNNSDTVVIVPDMDSGVTKAEVSIPADIVSEIAEKSGADVRVEMPVAFVTIPNEGLSGLAAAGGNVTVSAEKSGSTVTVTIAANGKRVDNVNGGVTVSVPQANCGPGTVAMLVREDGSTEVIRQSISSSDGRSITVPLDGSATIVIMDNSVPLSDVPATSWAAGAVAFVTSHEIMQGTGDGIFDPNASMTRGMLATVLHNLENNPSAGVSASFGDVASGAWYAEAVAWAAAKGIVTGYADGSFGPNDSVTREQLAVMLYRYAGSPAVNASVLNFVDAGDVSGYAGTAIAWAVANGILNGKGNGVLDPQGTATRAEVAQMLLNFVSSMA